MDTDTFIENAFFLVCAYVRQTLPDEPLMTISDKVRFVETESQNGKTTKIKIERWDYGTNPPQPTLKDLRQLNIKDAKKLKREYLTTDTISMQVLAKAVKELYTTLNVKDVTGESWVDFIARLAQVKIDADGNDTA